MPDLMSLLRYDAGLFDSVEEAGDAYAASAREHFGEFARDA